MYTAVSTANLVLYIAYIMKALIWIAFGGLILGLAIWLVWPDGAWWFWDILAVLIGGQGISIIMSGLEQFVAANAKRQQQRHPQLPQHMRPAEREDSARSRAARYRN
ncbi:hypothetical protein ACWAT4_37030 [Bradyrhizobium manausense]